MGIPHSLECLYSAEVTSSGESIEIEVPKRELEKGNLEIGEIYTIAIIDRSEKTESQTGSLESPDSASQDPPVSEGDIRIVDIEGVGEQADGITRVERGFVVIVPETEAGDTVEIEIQAVNETVAFAKVVNWNPTDSEL